MNKQLIDTVSSNAHAQKIAEGRKSQFQTLALYGDLIDTPTLEYALEVYEKAGWDECEELTQEILQERGEL